MSATLDAHSARAAALAADLRAGASGLAKDTSNLFRDRVGHVIARAATQEQAVRAAEAAHRAVRLVIEPNL